MSDNPELAKALADPNVRDGTVISGITVGGAGYRALLANFSPVLIDKRQRLWAYDQEAETLTMIRNMTEMQ